MIKYIGNH